MSQYYFTDAYLGHVPVGCLELLMSSAVLCIDIATPEQTEEPQWMHAFEESSLQKYLSLRSKEFG